MKTLAPTLAAVLAAATLPALAGPSQSTSPLPGGYVTACGTDISGGGSLIPGFDLVNEYAFYTGHYVCNSQTFAGAGSAAASAQWSNAVSANTSSGQARLGAVHLQSANTTLSNQQNPEGSATGGWKDQSTLSLAGHQGEAAVWLVSVHAGGTFTSGIGAAGLGINAFKNNTELRSSVPGWDDGNSAGQTTDRQRANWALGAYGLSSYTFDDQVTFAIPVTLGTAFTWGVYGFTQSGQQSYGPGTPFTVTASSDVHFEFVGSRLMIGNTSYSDFVVLSGSGVDWHAATVPEPTNAVLLGAGLAAMRWWMRRRRQG